MIASEGVCKVCSNMAFRSWDAVRHTQRLH